MSERENNATREAAYLLSLAHRTAPLAVPEALEALKLTGHIGPLLAEHRKQQRQQERAERPTPPAA